MSHRRFLPLLGLALVLSAGAARAEDDQGRYFYFGYDYGTQASYSPMWVFVNRAYDVLQIRSHSRDIFHQNYGLNASNVADNLAQPFSRISEQGWGKFFREEIFPLSWTSSTARWVPNYSLHLLGGGMTYTMLSEWFESRDAPVPGVWSAATILAAAFVNETLENKGVQGRNTDAIADWYFFDIGGILLFSIKPVNRFFSRELILMDWSKQPAFTYPGFDLHNQGNYFAAKWPLPFWNRLRLFAWFGMGNLFGLSYLLDREWSVSAAGGLQSTRLANTGRDNVENVVQFAASGALFLDRKNSLLASAQISNIQDYFLTFNVYPGLVRPMQGLGLWSVMARDGNFILGLSTTYTFGVGLGKL